MNIEHRDLSTPPPPPEEGYWRALLREGEYAEPRYTNGHTDSGVGIEPKTGLPTTAQANLPRVGQDVIEKDWRDIRVIMDMDRTVDLHVIGYNRGGLLVEWRHLRGFVPASQLMHFQNEGTPAQRQDRLSTHVGGVLTLRVIELDPDQNRLVLSERAAQVAPGTRAQILDDVRKGATVDGSVTNITDFGVFVDLGGIEGLIHISELSWGRVAHPGDILGRGEQVRVLVLETNKHEGRIALSLKRLYPDPWQTVADKYEIGKTIETKITNVVEFGAFACIEEGLEGLIHVSELAEGHFLHPRNVVEEGQIIHARILSIDPEHRRLGLSLRQVNNPDME
jgi:small subunit ribosomal protein S1